MNPPAKLLLVALALGLPSCKSRTTAQTDPIWWQLEGKRQDLSLKLQLAQLRVDEREARSARISKVTTLAAESRTKKAELGVRKSGLIAEIESAKAELETLHETWIATSRAAAVGLKIASLDGSGGKTYEDVIITRVTDVGIEFRHTNGSGRLAAEDLSAEQLNAFGIDLADARIALQDERAEAHAYAQWVDQGLAEQKAVADRKAEAAEKKAKSAKPPLLAAIKPVRPNPLNERPRSYTRGYSNSNFDYYSYPNCYSGSSGWGSTSSLRSNFRQPSLPSTPGWTPRPQPPKVQPPCPPSPPRFRPPSAPAAPSAPSII